MGRGGLGGQSEREEGCGEDGGEAREEREESGSSAPSRCLAGMISSVNHNQLP